LKTREEIDREAALVIRAAIKAGVLADEERIYVRDENSPETGFWRELMPDEINNKRRASSATRDAFPREKTGEIME